MRIINAILSIDESSDPPTAGLTVEVEGHPPVLRADNVPPADMVEALRAVGAAVGIDLVELVADEISAVVEKIEDQVQDGKARQQQRERALVAWREAASQGDGS